MLTNSFLMLVHVAGKDSDSVVRALTRQVQQLPQGLMSSLTWDRGMELAEHKRFTVSTDALVYFCDPRSPWQRGSNENTNGLLRQYFPKGPTSQDTVKPTSMPLPSNSTRARERPLASEHQALPWPGPLHRPVEPIK